MRGGERAKDSDAQRSSRGDARLRTVVPIMLKVLYYGTGTPRPASDRCPEHVNGFDALSQRKLARHPRVAGYSAVR
jgi:hypothetical protein